MLKISEHTERTIEDCLSQPHRVYHTLEHVSHVQATLNAYKDKFSDFQAAELAAKFHDIVYEVGDDYNYNEARSCAKFLEMIGEDNPDLKFDFNPCDFSTIELVLAMIGCTHGHTLDIIRNPDSLTAGQIEDIKMFLDADIKILSEDEATVIKFEDAIRKEFSIYNDVVYSFGRIKVLQSFLNRPHIYLSQIGEPWEQKARDNLHFLINRLKYKKT